MNIEYSNGIVSAKDNKTERIFSPLALCNGFEVIKNISVKIAQAWSNQLGSYVNNHMSTLICHRS